MVQEGKKSSEWQVRCKGKFGDIWKEVSQNSGYSSKKQTFKQREDLRHEKSQKGIGSGISA